MIYTHQKQSTASTLLVTPDREKMLLIFHNKLQVWLQPGGHQEWNENPWQAAIRECWEETGIDISWFASSQEWGEGVRTLPCPDFLQEQKIPAHKEQPEHFHIDHMYLIPLSQQNIIPETSDTQWKWMSLSEIESLPQNEVFDNFLTLARTILTS